MSLAPVLAPSGLYVARCDGDLDINSHTTRCAAWFLLDLAPAWRYGDKRGANRVLLGSSGTRAQRRFRTSTVFKFRMVFGGRFNADGSPAALAPMQQLRHNYDLARVYWIDDPGGDGTHSSTLHNFDGVTTSTADVQVLDLEPGLTESNEHDAVMRATLTIEVPRGGWV